MVHLLAVVALSAILSYPGDDGTESFTMTLPIISNGARIAPALSLALTDTATIRIPGYFVWEPSRPIKHDGTWHLYFMAWPAAGQGLVDSVVMHATSPDLGTWTVQGVALEPSPSSWDHVAVHTPQVIERDGRYYLFYTGTGGEGGDPRQLGVAVADDPAGPWTKSPHNPIVPLGDAGDWDGGIAGDAMPVVRDGRVWLYYKGRDAGGNRALGLAIADDPAGPYTKHPRNPLFDWEYELEAWNLFEAEGLWYLVADFRQWDSPVYREWPDVVYFTSADGLCWDPTPHGLASHESFGGVVPPRLPECNEHYGRLGGTASLVVGGKPVKFLGGLWWAGQGCPSTIVVVDYAK
jgi:hypothetical protein